MTKYKKITLSALTAILCVAVLIAGFFYITPKNAKAADSIGELYNSTNNTFNKTELDKLYKALYGIEADFETVKTKADNADSSRTAMGTGSPLNGDNTIAAKDITVTLGGKQWYAVYLSNADNSKNKDVVLTLWAKPTSAPTMKFSTNSSGSTATYPGVMYSTSLVRAYLTGKQYSTNGSTLTNYTQGTEWSSFFTALGGTGKYENFLVQPKDMVWQPDERAHLAVDNTSKWGTYDCVNESLSGANLESAAAQVVKKNAGEVTYTAWHEDYIWLPGVAEVGNETYGGGIWKCNSTQWTQTISCWLRSTVTKGTQNHYITNTNAHASAAPNGASTCIVRPAIHLNLTYAENRSAETYQAPQSVELDYNGEIQNLDTAKNTDKVDWYEKTIYDDKFDVTFEYGGSNFQPEDIKDAHEYTVTIKPKEGQKIAWSDSEVINQSRTIKMTINPAPITVTIPTSGTDGTEEFRQSRNFAYHVDLANRTDILRFPDTATTDNTTIKLCTGATTADKESLKIYYYILTHAENEHDSFDIEGNTPAENAPDKWKEFDPDNPDEMFKLQNKPLGYCVYYKITAPNHKAAIGHFSVHVFTETLKITTKNSINNKLAENEYGYTIADQAALHTLIDGYIETITDQYEGDRKTDLLKPDNEAKFTLYFTTTHDGSGTKYNTDGSYFNVGKYYLQAKYNDGESYINFKWNDGTETNHPYISITQKTVSEINWTGNPAWGDDGATVKEKASQSVQSEMVDAFNWVYDGKTTPKPTATFEGVDGSPIDLDISVASPSVNAGRYIATASTTNGNYKLPSDSTKEFYIRKAANDWINEYTCDGWSMGAGTATAEQFASANFGTVTYEYHKDTEGGDIIPQNQLYKYAREGVDDIKIVVVYKVDGTNNFDGLDKKTAEFTIIKCTHAGLTDDIPYEQGDENGHFRTCPDCNLKVTEEHSYAQQKNDNQHWQECSVCHKAKEYTNHDYTIAGRIISAADCTKTGEQEFSCECGATKNKPIDKTEHQPGTDWQSDGEKHWHICTVCGEIAGEKQSHDAVIDDAVQNTCVLPGKTSGSHCSECGYKIIEQKDLPALGHNEDDLVIVPATCTKEGSRTGKCSRCQENVYEVIPKIAHTYEESVVKEATCTAAGQKAMVCTVCGTTQENSTTSIAALGHDYGEFETTKAATCTAKGKKQQTCSRCNDVHEEDIPAMGHDFTKHDRVEPTATETGNIEYYECSICEKCYRDQEGNNEVEKSKTVLPALGTGSSGGNQLGGDTGLGGSGTGGSGSSGASDFLEKNWLWIVLALAAILVVAIVFGIVAGVMRRRREQRFMEMMARSQGGYQPMSNMQYPADGQRPIFVIGQPSGENGQQTLQLPSGLDEETLANAIALAMQKVNANKPQESENADVDGFYDDVEEEPKDPTGDQ